jgi:hypothetical protein
MDAPTITIGAITTTLIEPSPLAVMALIRQPQELEVMGLGGVLALSAAALAVSWPRGVAWPTRSPPRPWRPGTRIEDYGHSIYDDLRAGTKGMVPMRDLHAALVAAKEWCESTLLTEAEVQAAQDFSEPPAGG